MTGIRKKIAVVAWALLSSVALLHAAEAQKGVVLTFDDSCKSHASFVAPLLKKHGIPKPVKKGTGKIFPPGSQFLQVAGHDAYLALPEGVEAGEKTPWLWYCPSDYKLPGKLEQWMMNKCLAHGIAVAGIDVRGDFGTPAGRATFTAFHKELKNHNPIDRLSPLAKARVPIYHNTGDVDTLVPAKDNSFLVEKRYKALGGEITVTVFKGQGHNYWTGFFEDEAMAAFIIEHARKEADLPKVLIIGDSISGGYSKPLIRILDGKAEVTKLGAVEGYRIQKETFWHSRGFAKNLDFGSAKACIVDFERFEKHLAETKYDVIHFNFGLNDIFRGRNGAWHNPVDQYAKDLAKIATLLKRNGANIIWANTTPIPANAPHNPEGDELIYNAAAENVMKKHDIPINELHGVVTRWDGYAEWKKGDDVHFPGAVYSQLAEQIAEKILEQIGTPGAVR